MKNLALLLALTVLSWNAPRAQELTLAPLNNQPQRFKDLSGHPFSAAYAQSFSYAVSQVVVQLDAPGKPYLSGLIKATGLKPNFAYQLKLAGRASQLAGSGSGAPPDDGTNAQLGLIGRWWRAYPNAGNSNDSDYFAHKDDPSYAYSGYLLIGFFVTDELGAAQVRFEGSNSFHVLWRTNQRQPNPNDGPEFDVTLPATANNPAYDPAEPAPALALGLYGEWEPTRALPNTLSMPAGHYACDFVLTEESFHDSGAGAGNWTSVLAAPLDFDSSGGVQQTWALPADVTYPATLGPAQLDAHASVPGTFSYTPAAGTLLAAGTHTLTAQFTPDDSTLKTPPPLTVNINVQKGLPTVSWNPPQSVRADAPLKGELSNYAASVPGSFASDLPPSGVLAAGTHVFTLQFTPADLTDYATPAPLSATIDAIIGLLISSPPDAAPNPAYAGRPVRFSAQSLARGLKWNWDFGDGTPPATAASAEHVFIAPGDYTVTLTAAVAGGRAEQAVLAVKVLPVDAALIAAADDDGDGFSNALEMALGSDPLSGASTPEAEWLAGGLNVARCDVRAPLAPAQVSVRTPAYPARLRFKATLALPQGQRVAGQTLALDLGGNVLVFRLDEHGRGRTPWARASVRLNAAGVAAIELDAAGFDTPLSGALSAPGVGTIKVLLLLGPRAASAQLDFSVTQSRGALVFEKQ